MKYLLLELKICEGCGTLWLRRKELPEAYCAGCTQRLAGFPAPSGKRPGGRPRTRLNRTSRRGCAAAPAARAPQSATPLAGAR